MAVFKTKEFNRFARRERITSAQLLDAVERLENGLIDADLGEGMFKQRVARPGQGRSRGFRTLLAFRAKDRAIFVYGFAKKERENIERDELMYWRKIAATYFALTPDKLKHLIELGELIEVADDEER